MRRRRQDSRSALEELELGVLAKAKASGLIPSFYAAAQGMREQGIHYSDGLITRLAQHLGEINP